jgi:hypothetical protein
VNRWKCRIGNPGCGGSELSAEGTEECRGLRSSGSLCSLCSFSSASSLLVTLAAHGPKVACLKISVKVECHNWKIYLGWGCGKVGRGMGEDEVQNLRGLGSRNPTLCKGRKGWGTPQAFGEIKGEVYAARRVSRMVVGDSVAGRPESEFGASRCAPRSTPTPKRSTNSPPSQPVTSASTTATKPSTSAPVLG